MRRFPASIIAGSLALKAALPAKASYKPASHELTLAWHKVRPTRK